VVVLDCRLVPDLGVAEIAHEPGTLLLGCTSRLGEPMCHVQHILDVSLNIYAAHSFLAQGEGVAYKPAPIFSLAS